MKQFNQRSRGKARLALTAGYEDDPANCEKYGRLYDWETAMKACPAGWHLPSDDEWTALVNFVGGEDIAGKKLKAKSGWDAYGESGNGTDEFGFSALPSGGSGNSAGDFLYVGNGGDWWSANELDSDYAYGRGMDYGGEGIGWNEYSKNFFYYVRCVKD